MCGIAGLLLTRLTDDVDLRESVGKMASTLFHRGPDESGAWIDRSGRVGFGHRRLSVVDLSPAGHQPMSSQDGRWTIVYNGEMYNAEVVRAAADLSASSFRGHSDTEVLVELIARRGVEYAARRAVGMFAFAVWDSHKEELWLVRDRFGEKPLYLARANGLLAFASELKALRHVRGLDSSIDPSALDDLLRYGYVIGEKSILRGVSRLPPGSLVRVSADGSVIDQMQFWSPQEAAGEALTKSPLETEQLLEVLRESVRARMVSDVPLGAFLSGGIDSSLVVALMSQVATGPVKTFTVGFGNRRFDESSFARQVAAYLGTDHHEWILSDQDLLSIVPKLPTIYDEPFADSSQIPTSLLSSMTRRYVTVALSGDGGDELFGGYERYKALRRYDGILSRVPAVTTRLASRIVLSLPANRWNSLIGRLPPRMTPAPLRQRPGERIHKLGNMLSEYSLEGAYEALMSHGGMSELMILRTEAREMTEREHRFPADDALAFAMLHDTEVYLPDDILTKVDRASMASSLEVRVPLLDPVVFDAAWRIPREGLITRGHGKLPTRQLLKSFLPESLVDRPKQGFGVPMDDWLRGPLRRWGDQLLDPEALANQGYLRASIVRDRWDAHQSGLADLGVELWPVLMFQAWLEEWS